MKRLYIAIALITALLLAQNPGYASTLRVWSVQPKTVWYQTGKVNNDLGEVEPEDPIQTPEEPMNWALMEHGGTWSASSGSYVGLPEHAFDGNTITSWSGGNSLHTLYRELPEPKHITFVRVQWVQDSRLQTRDWCLKYRDVVSNDWLVVNEGCAEIAGTDPLEITCDIIAQEWSIAIDLSYDWSNITEFELWSIPPEEPKEEQEPDDSTELINWALTEHGGTWSASHYNFSWPPQNAFDGEVTTCFGGGSLSPATLYRELPEPKHIASIRIHWLHKTGLQTRNWCLKYRDPASGDWLVLNEGSAEMAGTDPLKITCDVVAREWSVTIWFSHDWSEISEFELWSPLP